MEGRENKVAGKRHFYGDVRGFLVADLADKHDIGVLPQNRTQRIGEGEAYFAVCLDLRYAFDMKFHRVFDRYHVPGHVFYLLERGIERGGFPAAGGAGDDDHAVGLGDLRREHLEVVLGEAEAGGALFERLLVKDAQHRLFPEYRRQDGDADVDLALAHADHHAAVLGQAALRDVEV